MESSDESPSLLAGKHVVRVAARGLNEVSLVLQHFIALEGSLRTFIRETPSLNLQPWLIGRTFSPLVLSSINGLIRRARKCCIPGVLSPWVSMIAEDDLRSLYAQTALLYREVMSQLGSLAVAADQPWQDTSMIQEAISLLSGERDRLFVLHQELPGFRNQTRGEVVALSPDDERLASSIVIPTNDEGPEPEVVYLWLPTEEPKPEPTEPVRIEGIPPHSRAAAREILSTVHVFIDLLKRVQELEPDSEPVLQAAAWATVTTGGDNQLLSSNLDATRKAVDAVHSVLASNPSEAPELNRDLHELRRAYFFNAEQLLHILADAEIAPAPQRKLIGTIGRLADKLRYQVANPSDSA
jgi:hypothetical protein